MKFFYCLLASCSFFVGDLFGQAIIVGPNAPVPEAEMVILKVEVPPINNLQKYKVNWKVFDNGREKTFLDGVNNQIAFSTGRLPANTKTNSIDVIAAVSYLFTTKEGDKILSADLSSEILFFKVVVGETPGPNPVPPGPNPPVPPNPDPEPNIPDTKYGFTKFVYQGVKRSVPISAQKASGALASSFRSILSAIAAGTVKDVEEALKKTSESNRAALASSGVATSEWMTFLTELQHKLIEHYNKGNINSLDQVKEIWAEIADGLAFVKAK